MPEVEFRDGAKSVDEVLAEFDSRKDRFEKLKEEAVRLIQAILDVKKIKVQAVYGRVKSREKLKSKYSKPDKVYKGICDMPDVVGLRIITYYSDEIDQIKKILTNDFEPIGPIDDKRIGKLDSFGYSALHIDCAFSKKRLDNIELQPFANDRFEIQITTVLGHAWAEMHHAWYDSSDAPTEEERRFYRLAAVLELAEQEFLEIRRKKEQRERTASLQVAAELPDIPITLESLKAFIEQKDFIKEIDEILANMCGSTIALNPDSIFLASLFLLITGIGISSIQDLEEKMKTSGSAIIEFVRKLLNSPYFFTSKQRKSYYKGFSVFQFASILAGALGVERYWEIIRFGPIYHRREEADLLVNIAKEVASEFHLS